MAVCVCVCEFECVSLEGVRVELTTTTVEDTLQALLMLQVKDNILNMHFHMRGKSKAKYQLMYQMIKYLY